MLTQEWDMGKALDTRFMEGTEKGVDREKIETARHMLADGLNPEVISKYTRLSMERIKSLKPLASETAAQLPRL